MPVVLPSSFTVGDSLKLWPKNPDNEWCDVVAPSGREFKLKVFDGYIQIWLAQVGAWHYYWSADDHGMLNVVSTPVVKEEVAPAYEIIDGG